MYENLAVPLPDLSKYLERIGISAPAQPTRQFLDELILSHQTHVPFEALDPLRYKAPVSLEIPDLYDKIVTRKRGGFCFELNLLFRQALTELGFDVFTVFSRFFHEPDMAYLPASLHCANIVRLEDTLYFCDVGLGGPQPPFSVPVRCGEVTKGFGEEWRIERYDDQWLALLRTTSEGETVLVLHFNLFRQTPQDFLTASAYCSSSPDVIFTQTLMTVLRTPDGSRNIMDNIYTKRENGACERIVLESPEETKQILEEDFGIVL